MAVDLLIPTWITGPLAILAVYWCLTLANRPSQDGINFRPTPPLRVMYPAVLTGFLVMIPFVVYDILTTDQSITWNYWLTVAGLPFFCVVFAITWPPTITATNEGLRWRRLLIRRFIPWSEIEGVVLSCDERVVIYCRSGKQYEVSTLIQGRPQLAALVQRRLDQLDNPQKVPAGAGTDEMFPG